MDRTQSSSRIGFAAVRITSRRAVDVTPPSGSYDEGSSVTLTPVPDDDHWRFHHWEGDVSGTGPITVTVDGDLGVRPVFVRVAKLAIAVDPPESGDIAHSPEPTFPVEYYLLGARVDLTAVPRPGFRFDYWERADGTAWRSHSYRVALEEDIAIAAHFLRAYSLTWALPTTQGGGVENAPAHSHDLFATTETWEGAPAHEHICSEVSGRDQGHYHGI